MENDPGKLFISRRKIQEKLLLERSGAPENARDQTRDSHCRPTVKLRFFDVGSFFTAEKQRKNSEKTFASLSVFIKFFTFLF